MKVIDLRQKNNSDTENQLKVITTEKWRLKTLKVTFEYK